MAALEVQGLGQGVCVWPHRHAVSQKSPGITVNLSEKLEREMS